MPIIPLTFILLGAMQSPSTMANVAIFTVNAERKWPSDEREPAITAEALRLLEVSATGIADDRHIDDKKVRESIADFKTAREAFEKEPRGGADRPKAAREALAKGRSMLDALADALDLDDQPMQKLLSDLKRTTDDFDRRRPIAQQADLLEKYFRDASQLTKELLDAPKG
jgi:hypothetical protein